MDSIGDRLRKGRNRTGLTQDEVASKLGVTRSVIARYESETNDPPTENIVKMAEMYGVSADWLFCLTDDPRPIKEPIWKQEQKPSKVEFQHFLSQANIYFDGDPLTDEDKEDLLTYLEVKWRRE